jgi:hypothetical protein
MKNALFSLIPLLLWSGELGAVPLKPAGQRETARAGSKASARPAAPAPYSEPLPLALDDAYEVEKVFSVLIDPVVNGQLNSPWMRIERDRRYYGAINAFERSQREGHCYTVHWKAKPAAPGDLTVRFEYRQQRLGSHVQIQEAQFSNVSGRQRTEFAVQGDDYHQDGAVTAWRVLLISQGRVVGLQQSFLW